MFDESLPLFSESPPDTFILINGGEIGRLEIVFAITQTLWNEFPAPQKEKKWCYVMSPRLASGQHNQMFAALQTRLCNICLPPAVCFISTVASTG